MRDKPTDIIERGRIRHGDWASTSDYGCCGAFVVTGPLNVSLKIIATDGTGLDVSEIGSTWEHVSVSKPKRAPSWEEMAWVKDQFWTEDETCVQFHPRKDEYVNCHPFCLHIWKRRGAEMVLPPSILVGPRS